MDNKKLLLWAYTIFIAAIVTSLIIILLNTKNIVNMYIVAAIFGVLILSLFYITHTIQNEKIASTMRRFCFIMAPRVEIEPTTFRLGVILPTT